MGLSCSKGEQRGRTREDSGEGKQQVLSIEVDCKWLCRLTQQCQEVSVERDQVQIMAEMPECETSHKSRRWADFNDPMGTNISPLLYAEAPVLPWPPTTAEVGPPAEGKCKASSPGQLPPKRARPDCDTVIMDLRTRVPMPMGKDSNPGIMGGTGQAFEDQAPGPNTHKKAEAFSMQRWIPHWQANTRRWWDPPWAHWQVGLQAQPCAPPLHLQGNLQWCQHLGHHPQPWTVCGQMPCPTSSLLSPACPPRYTPSCWMTRLTQRMEPVAWAPTCQACLSPGAEEPATLADASLLLQTQSALADVSLLLQTQSALADASLLSQTVCPCRCQAALLV